MYTEFFNLREKPFNLTPSPRFLYLGESHKEALALLTYGVVERKGFILLTGEVGTGKTTIVQALLSSLDQKVQRVHLSNPLLSPREFISYLARSVFKTKADFRTKAEFLLGFEGYLRKCAQHQDNFVLIIDEAQKLSYELLEEIRLLSNMETADEKLINIFLVGQPELNEKLSEQRCRPLLQRISIRHHISPLNLKETGEYLRTRLQVAGAAEPDRLFPDGVVKAVHRFSQGYPRLINVLADNALLLAYSKETRKITPRMIEECYRDLQLEGSTLKSRVDSSQPGEADKPAKGRKGSRLGVVLAIVFVAALFAFGASRYAQQRIGRWVTLWSGQKPESQPPQEADKVVVREKLSEGSRLPPTSEPRGPASKQVEVVQPAPPVPVEEPKPLPRPEEGKAVVPKKEAYPRTATVKEGDTLAELAASMYGSVNGQILSFIQKHNPALDDINRIRVGQEIVFPPLDKVAQAQVFTVHIASYKPFGSAREMFERLQREGHEAYIIPFYDPQQGKVFRVTVGNFDTRHQAELYAARVLKDKVSDYAGVVQLETK